MPAATLTLHECGRLPSPADNVAIATRQLEAGTSIELGGASRTLKQTLLEGHRFAVRPIAKGEALLSWGMPFGHALTDIEAGDYVCNQSILEALAVRRLGIALPERPNFQDYLVPFELNESTFVPAPAVERATEPRTFLGYRRSGLRGVGTRNVVVLVGTSSRAASFVRQLAQKLQPLARVFPQLDGIVAVAHTEGGGTTEPNNATEVLRALAGFMVHPNVGAILAVDEGTEPISNARLRSFLETNRYPIEHVPHAFLSTRGGLATALAEGEALVRRWLPTVAQPRTSEPLSELRVALQCGGSDAFSGVSGNPLAGAVVHEVIRHGGIGVLCETDEVAGAEAYIMKAVRDISTARALLDRIASFRTRLSWHGVTPESNPSAGNKLRGLYNITLKSLGAVHKKDPRTRVDHVIDYAEPLTAPGFYFMNSPGNDLEGIAGQVGAGCNLFLFVTGNGSITNFPFVPTLKITTTTRRHQLLVHEMDINAGRYLDGESMEKLTVESLDLLIATASGQKTRGEAAGHSQASLWRNWRQTDGSQLAELKARPAPTGEPLPFTPKTKNEQPADALTLPQMFEHGARFASERLGLVLPTSMCSAQIARLAADRMNASGLAGRIGIDRFVTFTHTEGCGFGGESMYRLLNRTYRGYATHPNVVAALLLEHGCEKIPNDAMRREFESAGLPLQQFGWASVQLDGGIDKAITKVADWFEHTGPTPPRARQAVDLGALTLGLASIAPLEPAAALVVARVASRILSAGGTVLVPESDPLLTCSAFRGELLGESPVRATLAYGQPFTKPGFHVVATETDHWVENLSGLGACGAHFFLGVVHDTPQQGHPMLPLLQVSASRAASIDIDFILPDDSADATDLVLRSVSAIVSGESTPKATAGGFVDFQLSRGLLGVST
jgi:altronate dehydratase